MAAFELKNVKYKDILNIEALDITSKKVTTLFGESGSGKSTLMKLLNQLISSDEGELLYNGEPIENINTIELRRQVIMLSQTPAIFDGNIRDNLLIGLGFSGKDPVQDQELNDKLKMVHLHKNLDDDADSLSGGEKQRLAFARVILMDASVYLLDEPTSALDEETEALVMENFIQYVRDKQKTVVMVTHSKKVAETFSDEIIWMKDLKASKVEELSHD